MVGGWLVVAWYVWQLALLFVVLRAVSLLYCCVLGLVCVGCCLCCLLIVLYLVSFYFEVRCALLVVTWFFLSFDWCLVGCLAISVVFAWVA